MIDIDAAVAAADKALYEAKKNGRDRVEFLAMAEERG
jgi:PleD family two-component response regulator